MSQASLMYWQDQFGKALPRRDTLVYSISAAKTSALISAQSGVLSAYDALTQAQIDAFLGSTNEILATSYDATAMGTDAFGVIWDFNGQCQTLVKANAYTATGTGLATQVPRIATNTGLTASTLSTAGALTTRNNVGLRFVITGLDALTSGLIVVELDWISK